MFVHIYEGHGFSDPNIELRKIMEHEIVPDNLVAISLYDGDGSENPRFEVGNLSDGNYTLVTTTAEGLQDISINSSAAVYEFSIRNGEAVEVNVEFE
jgi:hypothetical protein